MNSNETIFQFSSKLSSIAGEAKVLGKIYKDQKLDKKLQRCLPPKFATHKAVMRVTWNIFNYEVRRLSGNSEIKVQGILMINCVPVGITFKAGEQNDQLQEIKEHMVLLTKHFSKALK